MKVSQKLFLVAVLGLWIVSLLNFSTQAAPIDLQHAQQIAQKHLFPLTPTRGTALKLLYTSSGIPTRNTSLTQQDYYVFGHENPNQVGYVIVAGDDCVPEVLGYSHESPFVVQDMPEQLRYWLDTYTQWVQQERKKGIPLAGNPLDTEKTPIAPLLGSMIWDQNAPYNRLTPKISGNNAPVGCVATALSQIMRYHAWPRRGRGSIKYEKNGHKLHKVFGHEYAWANMPNRLTNNSPRKEKIAASILCRDVGYIAKMGYGANASGAFSEDAYVGLRKYMRYSNQIALRFQNFYSYKEWVTICLDELKAKRPIYYAGSAVGVGHAFVCDGYDGNGLFHFNWGWNGASNGYFVLTNLDPSVQSTGGGGEGGYILGNEIITGMTPNDAKEPHVEFICNQLSFPNNKQTKTKPVVVTLKGLWNYSYHKHNVKIMLQVYNSNGEVVKEFQDPNEYEVAFMRGFKEYKLSINLSELNNGTYFVRPKVYRIADQSVHPLHLNQLVHLPSLKINGTQVEFQQIKQQAQLEVTMLETDLYQSQKNQLVFDIENKGVLPYSSYLMGLYAKKAGSVENLIPTLTDKDLVFHRSIQLQPGEKQTVRLNVNGPAGPASHFHFYFNESGDDLTDNAYPTKLLKAQPITLKPAYSTATITKAQVEFLNKFDTYQNGSPITAKLRVKAPNNKGLSNRLVATIKVTGEEGFRYPYFDFGYVILKPGAERIIEMSLDYSLPENAKCLMRIGYVDPANYLKDLDKSFAFTVHGEPPAEILPIPDNSAYPDGPDQFDNNYEDGDKPVAVDDSNHLTGITIGPNPAYDRLNLYIPETLQGRELELVVCTPMGQEISHTKTIATTQLTLPTEQLVPGLYLLRIRSQQDVLLLRFVKEL